MIDSMANQVQPMLAGQAQVFSLKEIDPIDFKQYTVVVVRVANLSNFRSMNTEIEI